MSDVGQSVCRGCGAAIPPSRGSRPRLWCSDRCRKQTLYAGTCIDCGAPTNGYNGPGTAGVRCHECAKKHATETRRWTLESIELALRDWVSRHGRFPTTTDARKDRTLPPWNVAAINEAGGWRTYLVGLGLKDPEDLRGVHNGQGKPECPRCGRSMNYDSTQCGKCHAEARRKRRETVERMWADGATAAQVCMAIGSSTRYPNQYIGRMRQLGWMLPKRERP